MKKSSNGPQFLTWRNFSTAMAEVATPEVFNRSSRRGRVRERTLESLASSPRFPSSWRMFGSFCHKTDQLQALFSPPTQVHRCLYPNFHRDKAGGEPLQWRDGGRKVWGPASHQSGRSRPPASHAFNPIEPHLLFQKLQKRPPLPSHSATFHGLSRTYSIKFNNNIKIITL